MKKELFDIVRKKTPDVLVRKNEDYFRHDVIRSIDRVDSIGIELGVAGGHFSNRMVKCGKFKRFFGVDLYDDHHDIREYKSALKLIGFKDNFTLLRMSFDDACDVFEDNYFDFIYFDGYAHTGEEGGKTFSDWYPKLKVGGVFAGDDYHDDWPLVKWAVNDIVAKTGEELNITGKIENDFQNHYPSWFFIKTKEKIITPNYELVDLGCKIRDITKNKSIFLTDDQAYDLIKNF